MDISLELKGLPCLIKVYSLTYFTIDLEQQLNFEVEFGINQFRDISVPRRKH